MSEPLLHDHEKFFVDEIQSAFKAFSKTLRAHGYVPVVVIFFKPDQHRLTLTTKPGLKLETRRELLVESRELLDGRIREMTQ